jgi:hypothetical protein
MPANSAGMAATNKALFGEPGFSDARKLPTTK